MIDPHSETVRPRRRLFHRLFVQAIAIVAAAIAVQWAGANLREIAPAFPTLRFVDSFSAVAAISLIALSLSIAWQAGRSRQT